MLYLHTGAPGAGKTLSAVEFIETILAEDASRVIYSNINGMRFPGVIVVDNEWMSEWWDRATPGSLIVIDEAQKLWRATRGGGDPGRAVTDLEEHRHDGIDIVMITQHPTLIHANIRKLVTTHVHVVEYTQASALRWQWREAHDDVQEAKLRQSGEFKEWHYPKRLYEFYDSAFSHTKRTKRPRAQVKALIARGVTIVLVLSMLGLAAFYVPKWFHKAKTLTDAPSAQHGGQLMEDTPSGARVPVKTTAEYVAQQLPRVADQPWSAPIYDGQAVTQHPQVWCIAPEAPGKCTCITEQGTHYAMEEARCRVYASEGGTYDPYKPDTKRDDDNRSLASSASQGVPGDVARSDGGVPAGIPMPGSASGVGSQSYTPPTYGKWDPNYFSNSK